MCENTLDKDHIIMAKFYVQSGNLQRVVDSHSVDRAAVWAVHQAMQQIAPQFGDDEKVSRFSPENLVVLGDEISISEIGFDRSDCYRIDTFAAFRKWYALCEIVDMQ